MKNAAGRAMFTPVSRNRRAARRLIGLTPETRTDMTDIARDPTLDRDFRLDIVDEADGLGADLNRQADALLEENADRYPVTSVRGAVREDFAGLKGAARAKSQQAREHVVAHPQKSVLYALGVGVLLGLILAR